MISFEQARRIALDQAGPTWDPDDCGEYTVAGYGYEDATAWRLVDGSRRYFIDGDDGCLLVGQGCTFVDKETGAVFFLNYLDDPAVQPPYDQSVPGPELVQDLRQFRAGFQGAGRRVREDAVAANGLQCVLLEGRVLVRGRYPGVAQQTSHARKRTNTRQPWEEPQHRNPHLVSLQNSGVHRIF